MGVRAQDKQELAVCSEFDQHWTRTKHKGVYRPLDQNLRKKTVVRERTQEEQEAAICCGFAQHSTPSNMVSPELNWSPCK